MVVAADVLALVLFTLVKPIQRMLERQDNGCRSRPRSRSSRALPARPAAREGSTALSSSTSTRHGEQRATIIDDCRSQSAQSVSRNRAQAGGSAGSRRDRCRCRCRGADADADAAADAAAADAADADADADADAAADAAADADPMAAYRAGRGGWPRVLCSKGSRSPW